MQYSVGDYYNLLQRRERVEDGHPVNAPFEQSTGDEFQTSNSDSDPSKSGSSSDHQCDALPNDQALLSLALRNHYLLRASGGGNSGGKPSVGTDVRYRGDRDVTMPSRSRTSTRRHTLQDFTPSRASSRQEEPRTPSRSFLKTWHKMQAGETHCL